MDQELIDDYISIITNKVLYAEKWNEDKQDFALERIDFTDEEVEEYRFAHEEFEYFLKTGNIRSDKMKDRVNKYNELVKLEGGGTYNCFAAFIGDLESKICG